MSDNVYSSFLELLRIDSVISPLWAEYKGLKSVHAHILPEDAIEMPSACLISEIGGKLPSKLNERTYLINIYASNPVQAEYLASVIIDRLDDGRASIGGVTMRFTASGLTSFGNPTSKQFNSPIEVRVVNYGV